MNNEDKAEDFTKGKSWRFWAIFPSLMVTTLLSAVEVTVTSTALPTIVHDLNIGNNYVWIINVFLLISTAPLLIISQLADLWGRRWLMLYSVAIFTVGSGVAGRANDGNVLIRGKFIGIINVFFAIGLFLSPFVGVKYINAPLSARLKRTDYAGGIFVIGSTTAVLYAFTYAGTEYAWSNAHVLTPLIISFLSIGIFHAWEASRFCKYPTVPPRLFGNRTTSVALLLTFIHALMTLWTLYFLSVYFQAVQLVTPSRRFGKCKALHVAGMVLIAAGIGSLAALNASSSTAMWVCLQLIASLGKGIIVPAGVTILANIFNNNFSKNLWKISDPTVRATLSNGNAYAFTAYDFILLFPENVQSEIIELYTDGLRISWAAAAVVCGVAVLFTFLEKDIPLRASLRTEFGIKEPKKASDQEAQGVPAN
ncbi:major facilitator superfamily domain-containing protein [Diplogelasinospora grovesii]|uniref:Major facilitator superfamily domain-containing protein n=1 Tax=Diplogelasinospora grovesii TaxID=303347 RepID=A0AAN6N2I7_9PEZI|nr:major facilitator superfamily domain-containing protein [Diplogelasinospora grovesii]